jgi:hypothetical protein
LYDGTILPIARHSLAPSSAGLVMGLRWFVLYRFITSAGFLGGLPPMDRPCFVVGICGYGPRILFWSQMGEANHGSANAALLFLDFMVPASLAGNHKMVWLIGIGLAAVAYTWLFLAIPQDYSQEYLR